MKRILYLLVILGTTLVGCNPLDDIYSDIDDQDTGVVGSDAYTLTSDDYEELELENGSFNSEEEAKTMLPDFLSATYPYFGDGSSVLVGYDLYVGTAEGISDYTAASVYTLANSDYPQGNLNAVGFYPNEDPSDYMGNILDVQYSDAVEGQIVLAKYKQYTEQPIQGISNLVNADFKTEQTLIDWTTVSVTGAEVWAGTQYGATMDGSPTFPGSNVNEDWLISPEIDLTTQINPLFQVTQILNYSEGTDFYHIMVSTDYSGDVATATWNTIDVTPFPEGTSWTAVTSDDIDLSAYEGETIHIAFKYESDATIGATWEVEKALVKVPGVEGETISKDVYYVYTEGSWELSTGVYYLGSDDYDVMGTASGQPGQYDNFSSSIPADSYIPDFLSLKYPFAQQDDELIVIYKYYSSSAGETQTRGNLYTFLSGIWEPSQSTISTTLQFGVEDGVFVPDNTIRYTLTNADYEYIGNTLAADPVYSGIVSTLINYHDYDSSWSQTQIVYSLGVLLDNIAPNAEEGQKYLVTYLIYSGGIAEISLTLIKTDGVWVLKA